MSDGKTDDDAWQRGGRHNRERATMGFDDAERDVDAEARAVVPIRRALRSGSLHHAAKRDADVDLTPPPRAW